MQNFELNIEIMKRAQKLTDECMKMLKDLGVTKEEILQCIHRHTWTLRRLYKYGLQERKH
jgi:hypothetical protein